MGTYNSIMKLVNQEQELLQKQENKESKEFKPRPNQLRPAGRMIELPRYGQIRNSVKAKLDLRNQSLNKLDQYMIDTIVEHKERQYFLTRLRMIAANVADVPKEKPFSIRKRLSELLLDLLLG